MNKAYPAISVVMSVFNGEHYLEEAVSSVLDQSMQDFELIVINDGSTDNTSDILDCLDDPRLKVVNQSNQGLTRSLNTGIVMAKGEYIARMDADDICEPDRLRWQYEEMQRRPRLALLGTWAVQIDNAGKELERNHLPTGDVEIKAHIMQFNPFVHGSIMLRKQVLDAVIGYRNDFRFAQDYDLALRLSEHYELGNLPEYLYLSRHNREMISVSNNASQLAFAQLARMLHKERLQDGTDALERGASVEELLPEVGDDIGMIKYYQHLISVKCRQGKAREARSAVATLLSLTPYNPKLWAIGLATFLGPAGMRFVSRAWDRR